MIIRIIVVFMMSSITSTVLCWNAIIPVFHNLKPRHISESIALIKSRKQVTFSLRNAEAITAIPILIRNLDNGDYSIGASSVVSTSQIYDLQREGVSFISTMHASANLITVANKLSLPILCGVTSEKDAKLALHYGADALKFYPSSMVSPDELQNIAIKLSFKNTLPVFVAGSVQADTFQAYLASGATNFAIGFDLETTSIESIMKKLDTLDAYLAKAKSTH